jgi:hypothetical protein
MIVSVLSTPYTAEDRLAVEKGNSMSNRTKMLALKPFAVKRDRGSAKTAAMTAGKLRQKAENVAHPQIGFSFVRRPGAISGRSQQVAHRERPRGASQRQLQRSGAALPDRAALLVRLAGREMNSPTKS